MIHKCKNNIIKQYNLHIMDHTANIISFLEVLKKKEVAAKEPFKAKAYGNVIQNIKQLGKPITNIGDLEGVKGIGQKIKSKLEEYFNTGKVQEADNASTDNNADIIQALMNIHGVGPSKAKSLVEKDGIKNIEDLEKNQHLLNDKQLIGLKHLKDFALRIPRKEMLVHQGLLNDIITSVDEDFQFEITGSFRRQLASSGDIDVLITHSEDPPNVEELFKSILNKLKEKKYITDVFAEGGKKCLAVCRLKRHKHYRRIDLLYTNKKEYPFALLYFTGDAAFNVSMRQYCLQLGYSLSEHGLKEEKTGKFVDHVFEDEKDIFEFLGLQYVEPQHRNGNAILTK